MRGSRNARPACPCTTAICCPIEETLATAELALKLEPTLAAAHVARGLALLAQGRLDEAERAYERAIALEPEHYEAHYAYGRVCFQLGRKEQAARLFRRAAALRPSDIFSLLILMGIENGLGQIEKSLATARLLLGRAERELERQPESGRAAYTAAAALAALGNREGALRFAARALALEPDDHPCSTMSPAPTPASASSSWRSTCSSARCPVLPPIAGRGWPRTPTSIRCARTRASRPCCSVIRLVLMAMGAWGRAAAFACSSTR